MAGLDEFSTSVFPLQTPVKSPKFCVILRLRKDAPAPVSMDSAGSPNVSFNTEFI